MKHLKLLPITKEKARKIIGYEPSTYFAVWIERGCVKLKGDTYHLVKMPEKEPTVRVCATIPQSKQKQFVKLVSDLKCTK